MSSREVRRQLEEILEHDLLGPWRGEEEELTGEGPRSRYLTGFLAPRGVQVAREELDADLGDVSDEPEGPDRATPEAASTMFPRSCGLMFRVPAETEEVAVVASWGRYRRGPSRTLTTEEGNPREVWRREPVEHRVVVPLSDQDVALEPDPEGETLVRLRMTRRGAGGPESVVELALVNEGREPKTRRDAGWLFQVRLEVTAVDGVSAIFLPTDPAPAQGTDAEERQLAMLYRSALRYSVGRNVAVRADADPALRRAWRLVTEWLPAYEVPQTVAPVATSEPKLQGLELDMSALARLDGDRLTRALSPLASGYEAWLQEQEERLALDPDLAPHREAGRAALERGRLAASRIRSGIDLLAVDPAAREAFCFANRAMALQRVHTEVGLLRRADPSVPYEDALARCDVRERRSWRPFQLAFILLNLPALTDPAHADRSPLYSATVDLLFFPTGGGKTEAYLGLTAYTFAIRRLRGVVGSGEEARDGAEGVAVLMRYTLRLLTAQQFQRAATLVCACEQLRREGEGRWGATPFRIGLWVGMGASPNSYDEAAQQIRSARGQGRASGAARVLQILSCPWCGATLEDGRDLEPQDEERRVYLFCSDPDGRCPFSRRRSAEGLPVLTVDEEIYRLMPALVIGTVDKLAQLAWRGEAGMIFGRANRRCGRHGFRHPDLDERTGCRDSHRATSRLPAASTTGVVQPRPPDLIIQDELHLISGALGTMVGLYETMVDRLCTWRLGRWEIRPKIVSSTATIRRAERQVHELFGRRLAIFPPPIVDAGDTFFSIELPVSEQAPGRRYRGICAHGIRLKQAEIRLTTALLTAGQYLFDLHGTDADPYFTCVSYFNSLRELAGMRRLLDDEIAVRVRRGSSSRGLANRSVPLVLRELTSRIPSSQIAESLRHLEEHADPGLDSTAARRARTKRDSPPPIAVLLATNMLQVGVDVPRLGLMTVTGQPKNTAEYIQATSRIGRDPSRPGLIVTLFNWARPRDLAHFEDFAHYHQTFYRQVEPLSVTPFAARAVDRGLTGVLVAMVRNAAPAYSRNLAAQQVDLRADPVKEAAGAIVDRAGRITAATEVADRVRDAIQTRLDQWSLRRAHLEATRLGYRAGTDVEGLLHQPDLEGWDLWTAAYSLRETEPDVNLVLPTETIVDRSNHDAPHWVQGEPAPDDPDLEEGAEMVASPAEADR